MSAHPQQPLVIAPDGVIRFQANAIVRYLCDKYQFLNEVSAMDFSDEDHRQIAQLLGYSASGYGDLSYVSEQHAEEIDAQAEALRSGPAPERPAVQPPYDHRAQAMATLRMAHGHEITVTDAALIAQAHATLALIDALGAVEGGS